MKFGIYPGGRAATVCSHPPDPAAIGDLVDDLAGGNAFVVREYVHFFGDATPPDVVTSLGADDELAHLTMPDEWYAQAGRELDLVVSYIPQAVDLSGWLAFLDTVIDRYGHLTRYLQVTLEPNFPIPLIDGSAPGVLEALTLGIPHAPRWTGAACTMCGSVSPSPNHRNGWAATTGSGSTCPLCRSGISPTTSTTSASACTPTPFHPSPCPT